jgi:hypothetical protein
MYLLRMYFIFYTGIYICYARAQHPPLLFVPKWTLASGIESRCPLFYSVKSRQNHLKAGEKSASERRLFTGRKYLGRMEIR